MILLNVQNNFQPIVTNCSKKYSRALPISINLSACYFMLALRSVCPLGAKLPKLVLRGENLPKIIA